MPESETNWADTWLKPDQVSSLRDAVYDATKQRDVRARNDAMISLAYDAGLRPAELCGVTTTMFHADDQTLRLPTSVQKDYPNEHSPPPATIELCRTEYTSDTVRTIQRYLDRRDTDSMYLFASNQNDAIRPRTFRYAVSAAAEAGDIRPYIGQADRGGPGDVSPYSLRHSVAYRMLNSVDGYTINDVKRRLRHRKISTTEKHYEHFDRV